jgi:predicted phosphodiesterase
MIEKTIVLGDIHGWNTWKKIIEQENPNRVIFIGDYFDSFQIDSYAQINNFIEICNFKKRSGIETILLIGNHDYHYFPEIGNNGTSGYQHEAKYMIQHAISGNRDLLQMAYLLKREEADPILFTHAGVSEEWLDMNYKEWREVYPVGKNLDIIVNEIWKYKPLSFMFNGTDPYGGNTYQTPIWIRPTYLMRANKDFLKNKIIQVVGHTSMKQIDIEGKSTGGRYYFIDTLKYGEFLIIENNEIKLGKYENIEK